eukprot:3880867-Amphidinium_carterae.1
MLAVFGREPKQCYQQPCPSLHSAVCLKLKSVPDDAHSTMHVLAGLAHHGLTLEPLDKVSLNRMIPFCAFVDVYILRKEQTST